MRFQDDVTNMVEQDIRAAYTQFEEAPEFQGFMGAVWGWCKPSGIEDIRKHIGIYTVRVLVTIPLLETMGMVVGSTFTLCSPEILFLDSAGMRFEILYGIQGSRFHFEFPEEFMMKYDEETCTIGEKGVPLYSLYSGGTAAGSENRILRRYVEYSMVQDLRASGVDIQWEYAEECFDMLEDGRRILKPEIMDMVNPPGCAVQFLPKTSSINCPQFYAFITSYTRLNVLKQALTMDLDDLVLWKLDSLIYRNKGQPFNGLFRKKPVKSIRAPSTLYKTTEEVSFEKGILLEPMERAMLFAGAGGSGKSHYASKLHNLLYIAPMWSICADFRKKYHRCVMTPNTALGLGCPSYFLKTSWRPSNVFVDESTMIDDSIKNQILDFFPHARVIFGGDFVKGRAFQTTIGVPMSCEGLKLKTFNEDYRASGELVLIKQKIRQWMAAHYGDCLGLAQYVLELLKERIINVQTALSMYQLEDWMLCGTNSNVQEWTKELGHVGEKYLVRSHNANDVIKALMGQDVALNGDVVFVDNGRCEPRHAFTIHSVQGKTVESHVFVDMRRMDFDFCLLYTAISRARTLEQIFLVYG